MIEYIKFHLVCALSSIDIDIVQEHLDDLENCLEDDDACRFGAQPERLLMEAIHKVEAHLETLEPID